MPVTRQDDDADERWRFSATGQAPHKEHSHDPGRNTPPRRPARLRPVRPPSRAALMTTGSTEAASARRTAQPTTPQHGSRRSVAPLLGVVVIAAFLAAQALGVADEPAADASAADAVAYWSDHADKEMLISMLFAVSSAALMVFGAALRDALRELGGGVDRLASIAWAGTVIAATGIMTIVSITFTAADTAGSVAPEVTQTLSALNRDFFFPMAAGFALMLIASGSAATRLRGAAPLVRMGVDRSSG